jgi:hypothetical protein
MPAIITIPPQNVPLDTGGTTLFSKPWWLALSSLFGQASTPGTVSADGYYIVPIITAGPLFSATPDLGQGLNQEVDLVDPLTAIITPANQATAQTWTLHLVQSGAGGSAVSFDAGYAGAVAIVGMLDTTLGTYCSLTFVVRPDGLNALTAITTGLPIL